MALASLRGQIRKAVAVRQDELVASAHGVVGCETSVRGVALSAQYLEGSAKR